MPPPPIEILRLPLEKLAPDPRALEILRRLAAAGYESYLAGGCVRDVLLGKRPKDWDVATAARPETVERLFESTVPVGKSFGVMVVVLEGQPFEVATFRRDSLESDGRRPEHVEFAAAAEDARRRDFTINALFYDVAGERVIDYVGGLDDLRRKVLRAVGEPAQRFREDRLRMLRAVRFAASTGFEVDPAMLEEIRNQGQAVRQVSAERIGQELARMLSNGYAAPSLDLLEETRLLPVVLPEVARFRGVAQPPAYHPEGDVHVHTRLALAGLDATLARSLAGSTEGDLHPELDAEVRIRVLDPERREVLAWGVLLHDVGKPDAFVQAEDRIRFHGHETLGAVQAEALLLRLRRSGRIAAAVGWLVANHMRFSAFAEMRTATRKRLFREPLFPLLLELLRLDTLACLADDGLYRQVLAAWTEDLRLPPPIPLLLRGTDLIEMGYVPGPAFAQILADLEEAQLEGQVATPADARAWVAGRHPRGKKQE